MIECHVVSFLHINSDIDAAGGGLRLNRGSTETRVGRDPDHLHGHMKLWDDLDD